MLATIHAITDQILMRRSIKWRGIHAEDDSFIDCQKLYLNWEKFIYQNQDKLVSGKKKAALIQQCISNLSSVKNKLNQTPWSIPHHLNPKEYKIFINDLDFYLMTCGILIKSCDVFKGFIANHDLPAQTSMLPQFSSNPKRVNQALSILPESKWRNMIFICRHHNKYLSELVEFEKHLDKAAPQTGLYILLHKIYTIWQTPFANQFEEDYKKSIIQNINMRLKGFSSFPEILNIQHRRLVRAIFARIIMYGEVTVGKMIPIYMELIQQLLAEYPIYIHSEILFFKKQEKHLNTLDSTKLRLNRMAHFHFDETIALLNEFKMTYPSFSTHQTFIIWTHNPKAFVMMIHNAINDGYVSLRGNNDIKPIIEFLYKFVKVKKQNNSGVLSKSSLLTYFKKANSGEL